MERGERRVRTLARAEGRWTSISQGKEVAIETVRDEMMLGKVNHRPD